MKTFEEYKNFNNIIQIIFKKSPLQKKKILNFISKQNNDYFSTDIVYQKNGMSFLINDKNSTHKIKTKLFGKHNISNILASFSVASYLKIPIKKIIKAIKKFEGITRRFDIYYNFQSKFGEYTLINDYGHHPTEINFTLDTIKEVWKNQKICMIFQPHRYSRTENCIDQFIQVLSNVEKVIITETYSGGEQKTKFTSYYLYKKLKENHVNCVYVKEIKKIPQKLKSLFEKEDIVLVQGAGNISQVIKLL